MSHLREVKTEFTNKDCLIEALARSKWENAKGKTPDEIKALLQVHDKPVTLTSYYSNEKEKAHIVMPKQYAGWYCDAGFEWDEDSQVYIAHVDESDGYGPAWIKELTKLYAFEVGKKQMKADGWAWKEVTDEAGQIKLVAEVEVNTAQPKTWDRRPARKKNW